MPTEIAKIIDDRKPVYRFIGNHKSRGTLHQIMTHEPDEIVTWSIGAQAWTWRGTPQEFDRNFEKVQS